MKKLLISLILIVLLVPSVGAKRKSAKAGKITDHVFVDAEYPFQLTVRDNWKARVSKAGERIRLTLTQKNYAIPTDYSNAPDYTTVPKITVYVDTSSVGVHMFIDSLTADKFKSKQKKQILREFDFLNLDDRTLRGRPRLEFDEESGLLWKAQSKYVKEIQTSASSVGGKRVYGALGGAVAAVRHGENIYLFHVMCEWPYFDNVIEEVTQMLTSLKWTDKEE